MPKKKDKKLDTVVDDAKKLISEMKEKTKNHNWEKWLIYMGVEVNKARFMAMNFDIIDKKQPGIILGITPDGIAAVGYWPNFDEKAKALALRGLMIELMGRFNITNEEIRRTVSLIDAEVETFKETKKKNGTKK